MTEVLTAIFKAIDQVTPVVRQIDANTAKMSSSVSGAMSTVGRAIAAGLSVATVTAAARAYTTFGSTMVDLSAKTGISVEAIQQLRLAFGQSGVSIQTVAAAVTELGKRLVVGNTSASSALQQLHLNTSELIQLAPDQAFLRIADAVGKIENPMQRSAASQAIFGRQGKELLAGLTGELTQTIARYERLGAVISGDALKAADDFGDQLDVLRAVGMSFLSQVLGPMLPGLTRAAGLFGGLGGIIPALRGAFEGLLESGMRANIWLFDMAAGAAELSTRIPSLRNAFGRGAEDVAVFREQAQRARDTLQAFRESGVEPVKQAIQSTAPVLGYYGAGLAATATAQETARKATLAAEEAEKKFLDSVKATTAGFPPYIAAVKDAGTEIRNIAAGLNGDGTLRSGTIQALGEAQKEAQAWAIANGAVLAPSIQQVNAIIAESTTKTADWTTSINTGLMGALHSIPQTLANAFTGGGNILGAIKSIVTQVGSVIGGGIGSIFGPLGEKIGSALGSMVSLLVNPLRKLFGAIPEDVLRVRKEVDAFQVSLHKTLTTQQQVEAAGQDWAKTVISVRDEFGRLGLSADAAERIVRELWNTDRPERARAAMAAITDVIDENRRRQDILTEAIREYGFTIDELGPKFRAQKLAEQGLHVAEQWEVLIAAGIEVGTVAIRMKDKVNEYLAVALRTGTEVPTAMRPMLEQMIALGLLTDESGEKLTDLSRLTWAESLRASTDRIVEAIERLIGTIRGPLGDAINSVPREVPIRFVGEFVSPDIREPESFQAGTLGRSGALFRDFGRGTPAVLHGREAVVPESQAAAFAAALGGVEREVNVQVYLALDSRSGQLRLLGEAERQQIQHWVASGQIRVPARAIAQRVA